MRLIAKVIRISHAKFHCNTLITVQDIQDYASVICLGHSVEVSWRQLKPFRRNVAKLQNINKHCYKVTNIGDHQQHLASCRYRERRKIS